MKKSIIGDSRCPLKNFGEDWDLWHQIKKKNPTEYTLDKDKCFYHYNYPREGSLYWIGTHKENKGNK